MAMTDEELIQLLSEATDEQLGDIVAGMLFVGVKVAVDNGVPAARAMRDIMAGYFQEAMGSAVWKELGVNQRTAERWRHEIREMLKVAPELESDQPPAYVVESYERLRLQKIAQDQRQSQRMGA
jgi:hypothetical protein